MGRGVRGNTVIGAPERETIHEACGGLAGEESLGVQRPRSADTTRFLLVHAIRFTQMVGGEWACFAAPFLDQARWQNRCMSDKPIERGTIDTPFSTISPTNTLLKPATIWATGMETC